MDPMRIVIVDDEAFNVELMRAGLETAGHRVWGYTDSTEAEAGIVELAPDFALLDIMMPGVNGLELCKNLRAHPALAATKILMVTATAVGDYALAAKTAGADGFVTKPIDQKALVAQLEHMRK